MIYSIGCIDDGTRFEIKSKTPHLAMVKLVNSLNTARVDKSAVVHKTEDGSTLYFVHSGKTYVGRNYGTKRRV